MTKFDPNPLVTAFVSRTAPTIAECIERIEAEANLSPTRRRDLASGLRRLCKALDRTPDRVPADITWLRPRIVKLAPAALGLSAKSWANLLSDAHAALGRCGIVDRRTRRLDDLSPDWRRLWLIIIASGDQSLAPALGRFVRFLDALGIMPDKVGDEHLSAYREALAINELRKSPEQAAQQAAFGWNLAVRRIAEWPRRVLTVPSRSKRYALPLDRFPASFSADLAHFIDRLTHPDPVDFEGLRAALRPATIRHRRAQVIRFASALVLVGIPAEAITGLAALVEPANAERGLRWMLARNGGETSPGIGDIAIMLKTLSRYHVHAPAAEFERIRLLASRLLPPVFRGMTAQNRERLRPFDDPAQLRKLLLLPDHLWTRAQHSGQPHRALLDQEIALAIGILTTCPIRRRNLVGLHLEHNLRRMRDGRVYLVYQAGEVKNRQPVEFELPESLAARIDAHVKARAPLLCPADTFWLFPRRDGSVPTDPSGFSSRIVSTIHKEVGIVMNTHLFRHLAAKLWLEANPGHYEEARRLLGHAELSSTLNAYAGNEAATATRRFGELIDRARKGKS